ncbi:MAG: hypothetical protein JXM79_24580 [Sedimentisphaerales bacterium]|nr:hypothetical protein [Sedimentisphaerales bacterium]
MVYQNTQNCGVHFVRSLVYMVILFHLTGCSSATFTPTGPLFPKRDVPAQETSISDAELKQRNYQRIGIIDDVEIIPPDEELDYRLTRIKLSASQIRINSYVDSSTVKQICSLAGQKGGDLVRRELDEEWEEVDTVTSIDTSNPSGVSSVSELYSGGKLISRTESHGAFTHTTEEMIHVKRSWSVWRSIDP